MIRIILTLLATFMLYQCCTKDEKEYYKLTDKDRQVVPYHDQQVLKFRNNVNNTIDEVTVSVSEFSNDFDYSMCGGECCDIWKNIELKIIEFNSATRQELFPTLVINPYTKKIMFYTWLDFDRE